MKKIYIGADSAGFSLKEILKEHLAAGGYEVADLGTDSGASCHYPLFAAAVAKAVQGDGEALGILVCGTGIGMSMTANKFRGIYCIACESIFTAEKIALINNANVLAMGERVVSQDIGGEMALRFLEGEWCDGFAEERRRNNERGFAVLQQIEAEQAAL